MPFFVLHFDSQDRRLERAYQIYILKKMITINTFPRHFDWASVLLMAFVIFRWQSDNEALVDAAASDYSGSARSSSLFTSYWCDDDHPDYVHALPGYVPVVPPSCWYSGYLTYEFLGRSINTHYTLQIAEFSNSDDNVDSDSPLRKPLIYWSSYVY